MNSEVKYLVRNSLVMLNEADGNKKRFYIQMIKDNLDEHERGLKYLGIGKEINKVNAGKIILRIQRNKKI